MTKQQEKLLNKAIKELTIQYEKALDISIVHKPLAYALYHTWQNIEIIEKERNKDDERRD